MRRLPWLPLRVGVYVDAFNVYYGARSHCGRERRGWRWIDLMDLSEDLALKRFGSRARVQSLTYCTALRDKEGNPSSARDQASYIAALCSDDRVRIDLGQYNVKIGRGVLVAPSRGRHRRHTRVRSPGTAQLPEWLHALEVQGPEGDTNLLVSYRAFEEKGSDVNVATRLMADVLKRRIDAAIVYSNDGDLRLPLALSRQHVSVGLVNPTPRPLTQMLMGAPSDGVGGHWWTRLSADDYYSHQFSDIVGGIHRPEDW